MSTAQVLEVPGYEVVSYLGSGAKSTIWHIRDLQTDEAFALKRVVKRVSSDQKFLDQALGEFEIGVQLNHPVIRRVFRMNRVKRWMILREVHLIMEFCDGVSVQDQRPTSLAEALRIFGKVGEGLAYMNTHGFVHADTKPNNILVSASGDVKVIDLGQSCRVGTIKARIQGTPDFIAPEQVRRLPLDARTDVYNFGATLYWALTGRPIPTLLPKGGSSSLRHEAGVVPPEQFNPDVPASLSKLVVDCIEFNPSRRPPSMKEVTSRLDLISHSILRAAAGGNGK
jgi:serine/threonine-protein kinase